MSRISIEAMISEIDYQIKTQKSGKASMRSLDEMHCERLRSILGLLRWCQDRRELLIVVNKQLSTKGGAALAPIAGIGPASNGHDEVAG
jgi:hypothetical protein